MKIGFGAALWVRDNHPGNFHRMLDELSLEGYDGLEYAGLWLLEQYERRPGEFRELMQMHDLEFSATYHHCEYLIPERQQSELELAKRKADFLAAVGAPVLMIDGAHKRPEVATDDDIKVVAGMANRMGEIGRERGLTVAWHQHWGTTFEVKATFDRLMELTDPELVKFCPDTGQLTLGDFDLVETFKKYSSRIAYVHFKDLTFAGRPRGELWPGGPVAPTDSGAYHVDSRGRWVELGRGAVNFPAVYRILLEAGYDGWIVDDFDFTGYSVRESLAACKAYLNGALGVYGRRDRAKGLSQSRG